jgi:5-methylcytosine-specific restriction enzyme A
MPPLKACAGMVEGRLCGKLSSGTRCPEHTREQGYQQLQRKRDLRPYSHAERVRRREAVEAHRAQHGEWCPGWEAGGRAAHVVLPQHGGLSADHAESVARGGAEGGLLTVRCLSCNAAKGTSPA